MHIDFLADIITRAVERCCPDYDIVVLYTRELLNVLDELIDRVLTEVRPALGGSDVKVVADPQTLRRLGLNAFRPFTVYVQRDPATGRADVYVKAGASAVDLVSALEHIRNDGHYIALADQFASRLTILLAERGAGIVNVELVRNALTRICRCYYMELMNEVLTRMLIDGYRADHAFDSARNLLSCLAHCMGNPNVELDPTLPQDIVKIAHDTLLLSLYAREMRELNLSPLPYVHIFCRILGILNRLIDLTARLVDGAVNCLHFATQLEDLLTDAYTYRDILITKRQGEEQK